MNARVDPSKLPAEVHPDRDLITLGVRLFAAIEHEREMNRRAGDGNDPVTMKAYNQAIDKTGSICERIGNFQALTLTGLQIKARAIYWYYEADADPRARNPSELDYLSMPLAGDLVKDLLAMEPHR